MQSSQLRRLHATVWPTAAAALAGLGLLVAFEQVVAQSVVQGEQRRVATAAHSQGLWRCKLLRQLAEREQCLIRIPTPRSNE